MLMSAPVFLFFHSTTVALHDLKFKIFHILPYNFSLLHLFSSSTV